MGGVSSDCSGSLWDSRPRDRNLYTHTPKSLLRHCHEREYVDRTPWPDLLTSRTRPIPRHVYADEFARLLNVVELRDPE